MTFQFKTHREPLSASAPLWQLKMERLSEYQLLEAALGESNSQLRRIVEFGGVVNGEDTARISAANYLDMCCTMNRSLSWLLTVCIESAAISYDSDLVCVILSLVCKYEPLRINKDLDKTLEVELGSDFELDVVAAGNPRPKYFWFFMPKDSTEWRRLEVPTANMLLFRQFEVGDAGLYRCHVRHCLAVSHQDGEDVLGIYSTGIEVRVKPGSIWVKRTSELKQKCFLGTGVTFFVECESDEELRYQWYHNGDKKLVGETRATLFLQQVTMDMKGSYECVVKNCYSVLKSPTAKLEVDVPTSEQLERGEVLPVPPLDDNIAILLQPALESDDRKCAVGDKVSLRCLASCKYPLKYEWIKQGISKDLTGRPHKKQSASGIIRLAKSSHILDEIVENSTPVSHWIYQCFVYCPHTDQRVSSRPVMVQMSTYLAAEKCLPSFKVALVICQEDYDDQDIFVKLTAPKKDCTALIAKLREMDFEVLSFVNLTVEEFRNALELFCALVDESTYALFYFNGHALNARKGQLLLAATDSDLSSQKLVSQHEVETCLDACCPLLVVFIYDSCRKEAPEEVRSLLYNSLGDGGGSEEYQTSLRSSYIRSYGTRPMMENFEVSFRKASHGIYMKHLLKHLDSQESVGNVFELLTDSFTKCEDQSVASSMTPEFENGTKQRLCLSAPLRSARCGRLSQLHFNMCRYEPLNPLVEGDGGFSGCLPMNLGVAWNDKQGFSWNNEAYQGTFSIRLTPTSYDNESMLTVAFVWGGREAIPSTDLAFQVVGINAQLLFKCPESPLEGHAVLVLFGKCIKKPTEDFETSDGPIFAMREDGQLVGSCLVTSLQKVAEPVKFRLILHSRGGSNRCKGVAVFKLPITVNFPKLKMNNLVYKTMCNE